MQWSGRSERTCLAGGPCPMRVQANSEKQELRPASVKNGQAVNLASKIELKGHDATAEWQRRCTCHRSSTITPNAAHSSILLVIFVAVVLEKRWPICGCTSGCLVCTSIRSKGSADQPDEQSLALWVDHWEKVPSGATKSAKVAHNHYSGESRPALRSNET